MSLVKRCPLSLRHFMQIASRLAAETQSSLRPFHVSSCSSSFSAASTFCTLYGPSSTAFRILYRPVSTERKASKESKQLKEESSLPSEHGHSESSSVIQRILEEERHVPSTTVEKIKETGKDISYVGIFLACLAVTGALTFVIVSELFSGKSPNKVYSKALKMVKSNDEVIAIIGAPIKGYGELSSRGRRRHVSHLEYVKDDVNYMRMKFYVEGSLKKGTVQLEVKEDESGDYVYRYLFVDVEDFPPRMVVLVDNR